MIRSLLNLFRRTEVTATEFDAMKIVVGLGNPGTKYSGTRHNIGFDVIDALVERHAFGARAKSKFNANVHEVVISGTKVLLIAPLTYMNLSGQSVRAAVDFFKLGLENLMVICDDLNLDVGRIRIRAKGSAGGQNGIKDIIKRVGSQEFPRLRLGIGRPPANWDTSDYVLGKFGEFDHELIRSAVAQSVKACEHWIGNDLQSTMNRFNSTPKANAKKKQAESETTDSQRKPTD